MSFNTAERWHELQSNLHEEVQRRFAQSEAEAKARGVPSILDEQTFLLCILNEIFIKALIAAKEAYNHNSRQALRVALQDLGALYYGSKEIGHPLQEPVELPLLCAKLLELDGHPSQPLPDVFPNLSTQNSHADEVPLRFRLLGCLLGIVVGGLLYWWSDLAVVGTLTAYTAYRLGSLALARYLG